MQAVFADSVIHETLARAAEATAEALRRGGKLLVAGNGGSAADAQHLVAEFVVRLSVNRPAMRAVALTTDSSILTAGANDFGFETIFARQVEALGVAGDVFLAISTSGNSPNLLNALETARRMGLRTFGLSGGNGGRMAALCDYVVVIPSSVTMNVQESHLALEHIFSLLVERHMFGARAGKAAAAPGGVMGRMQQGNDGRNILMRSVRFRLAGLCTVFYLMLVAGLVVSIVRRTGGHFVYALDDPYIHLALAENLAHGHYGLNAAEYASPSSSILWPFLLVPFSGTHFHAYLPLALNMLFGAIAAALLGCAAAQWRPGSDTSGADPRLSWQQITIGILLVLCANLASLTIVGMEHVLQVLVAICCAFAVSATLNGRAVPVRCLAAALIAPMVRYEDLALTLAVAIAMAGIRRWKTAIALFTLSLVPVVGFSLFLKSKGLPALPMSVLVKGDVYANASPAMKLVRLVTGNVRADISRVDRVSVLLLLLVFAALTWRVEDRVRRFACASAALLAALQLTVGRFGWFHRYEVYALVFLLVVGLAVLSRARVNTFRYVLAFLALSSVVYVFATARTPFAAQQIYLQQYQMHRFVAEFYDGNYAVNDIGLVSFQRRPGTYVLDAFGLASEEAATQQNKTAAWLQGVVQRHGVSLAMVYPELFQIPQAWTPLARMCVPWRTGLNIQYPCVVFYSTTAEGEPALRSELARFAPTLPQEVVFSVLPGGGAR